MGLRLYFVGWNKKVTQYLEFAKNFLKFTKNLLTKGVKADILSKHRREEREFRIGKTFRE